MELRGIDVSKWQGEIDWAKVAAEADFAIIRAGYSQYEGGLVIDEFFEKNVAGAKRHGIPWGVYVYAYDKTPGAAEKTAAAVLDLLSGKLPEFPVYYDIEDKQYTGETEYTMLNNTAIAKAFCNAIRNAGYMTGVYSYYFFLKDYMYIDDFNEFEKWIADYRGSRPTCIPHTVWQYSPSGRITGINGNVDLNISYKDYPTIIAESGYNGWGREDSENATLAQLVKELQEVLKKYEHA